ncbi:hypothetical protein CAAN1_03S02322 [[Candida] anglica]|uniref:WKF domain-containing protein n=1 Tax=[Candida] anglica TaxID=148631 RepID=A0ABP0EGQ9_9ASCO
MSDNVPAWKKIGLKIKEPSNEDNLTVTHLESSTITTKQAKKLNKQKRKAEESASNDGEKKPPKRVKLPKGSRAPPPEKDQLAYLRQYHTDKDNWKFSKQKQNWILKNIRGIPQDYEVALSAYLEGLQGNSRQRIVEELQKVVKQWNQLADEAEAKVMAQLEKRTNTEAKESSKKGEDDEDDEEVDEESKKKAAKALEEDSKKKNETDAPPDYDYAVRCRVLIKALTDEEVELKGVESMEETKSDDEESSEPEEESSTEPVQEAQVNEEKVETSSEPLEDNLIVDTVEVSGYPEEGFQQGERQPKKSKKKSKKRKNEDVEVEQEEQEEQKESLPVEETEKPKKSKKSKKSKNSN